jgi:hypothetical protein
MGNKRHPSPERADAAGTPHGDEVNPAEARPSSAGGGTDHRDGDEPDHPDLRDPTNGSPYLTGTSSTTGLGGVGKETAGGGLGPRFEGGTVPGGTTDRPGQDT